MTVAVSPTPVRPEPERDRYGRYRIPDPKTGEFRSWTRATTLADSLSEKFDLGQWEKRMVAIGLAARPDLLAAVASVDAPDSDDGKRRLNKLCEDAKEYAGASQGANLGDALHSFAAQVDIGRKPRIPEPWANDITVYRELLDSHGIEVSPNFVERIVLVPSLGVAGTFDRLVRYQGQFHILDLKTEKGDLKKGGMHVQSFSRISIQLALYARGTHIWDVSEQRLYPMPKDVNRERALVVHLPAGRAQCGLYSVNIDTAYRMALVATSVREWRKRKDLAQLVTALEVAS